MSSNLSFFGKNLSYSNSPLMLLHLTMITDCFITVSLLQDYYHDTVLLPVLHHILNYACTSFFYTLSPLMLSMPFSAPSLIFVPLFFLYLLNRAWGITGWNYRKELSWQFAVHHIYWGGKKLRIIVHLSLRSIHLFSYLWQVSYHTYIYAIIPLFSFPL